MRDLTQHCARRISGLRQHVRGAKVQAFKISKSVTVLLRNRHSLRCVRKLDGQIFAVLHLSSMVSDCFPNQTACLVTSKVADRREDKRNRVEHFEVKCVTAIDEEVRQFSRDELLSCAEGTTFPYINHIFQESRAGLLPKMYKDANMQILSDHILDPRYELVLTLRWTAQLN